MKNLKYVVFLPGLALVLLAQSCATAGLGGKSDRELAAVGPTVVKTQTSANTFDLNNQLQPVENAIVYADIKDFQAPVHTVQLRFTHVPLNLKMTRLRGSVWETRLSPQQLRQLAVSGTTMKYDAEVVARDSKGRSSVGDHLVTIAVRAPDPTKLAPAG